MLGNVVICKLLPFHFSIVSFFIFFGRKVVWSKQQTVKMTTEKFSLTWNDFQQTVSNSFRSLRKETDFFDVTLVSDDEIHWNGHKLVLSACSGFFKSIIKKSSSPHPMIYLSGISSRNLEFIMDYIYQGEVQIFQEQLDDFLEVAQKLKIAGLINTNTDYKEVKQENKITRNNPEKSKDTQENEYFDSSAVSMANLIEEPRFQVEKLKLPSMDTTELDQKIQELIIVKGGTFTCSLCGKTASTKQNLGKHVETHIEGLSFPCQQCDRSFRSRNTLQKHKSVNHKSEF